MCRPVVKEDLKSSLGLKVEEMMKLIERLSRSAIMKMGSNSRISVPQK